MTSAKIAKFYNNKLTQCVERVIWPKALCVDDFGNEVHKCHWTDKLASIADAVITGGFMPSVKAKYIAVKDHKQAKKESHKLFNEMDANCNTCKHLCRVQHEKSNAGFLFGTCSINSQEKKLYPLVNSSNVMMFHPDDCMGMKCWEGR